ncbi:hypothetical protein CC2G_002831 [Coprinopsis cinerea AmutBmut pab1-1]|nr:hypothetical protein CC2G_002831 [Coprinopsis cinerea AmutBmut pab1-1]
MQRLLGSLTLDWLCDRTCNLSAGSLNPTQHPVATHAFPSSVVVPAVTPPTSVKCETVAIYDIKFHFNGATTGVGVLRECFISDRGLPVGTGCAPPPPPPASLPSP